MYVVKFTQQQWERSAAVIITRATCTLAPIAAVSGGIDDDSHASAR
jgi:hypothetical protein